MSTLHYNLGDQFVIGPEHDPHFVTVIELEGDAGFVGMVTGLGGVVLDGGSSVEHAGEFLPPNSPPEWAAEKLGEPRCVCAAGPPDEFGNRDQIVNRYCPLCGDGYPETS
jgi:hypothetical protein